MEKTVCSLWVILILLTFSYATDVYAFSITGKVVEISPNEIAITETSTTSSGGGVGGGANTTPSCTDSDGGDSPSAKGTVYSGAFSATDCCTSAGSNVCSQSGTVLTENYCQDGQMRQKVYNCDCSEGACKGNATNSTTIPACTDTDGGINYYTKGQVVTGIFGSYDCCLDGPSAGQCRDSAAYLVENYCSRDTGLQTYYQCPNGCREGACLPQNTTVQCTDTDGGINYYTKGGVARTVNGTRYPTQGYDYDYCQGVGGNMVSEFSCGSNGELVQTDYICPNGCKDGVCLSAANASQNKPPYIEYFTASNYLPSVNDTVTFKYKACDPDGKIISTSSSVTYASSTGSGGGGGGSGGNQQCVEGSFSHTFTQDGLVYVTFSATDNNSKATTTLNITIGKQIICSDSDGGKNYYVKGYVQYTDDSEKYWDRCGIREYVTWGKLEERESCKDENGCVLFEVSCPITNQTGYHGFVSTDYKCPNGCKDGACISTEEISIDYLHLFPQDYLILDGDDYFYADMSLRNMLTFMLNNVSITMSIPDLGLKHSQIIDSILPNYGAIPKNQFRINIHNKTASGRYEIVFSIEYNVKGEKKQITKKFEREISKTHEIKCTDSDGPNYYTKGKTTLIFPSGYSNTAEDSCCVACNTAPSDTGPTLSEYICSGNKRDRILFTCPAGCRNGVCINETSPKGSIKIIVADKQASRILYNAKVSIYDWTGRFVSSGDTSGGSAVFHDLPAGVYTAIAKASGYKDAKAELKIAADEDRYLTIYLEKSGANSPPKIIRSPKIPEKIRPNQAISFTWGAEDPDGDSLSWSVSWGDGTGIASTCPVATAIPQTTTIETLRTPAPTSTTVYQVPPIPVPDESMVRKGWTFTASHAWKNAGAYVVQATVSDCKGGSGSYSFKILVSGEGECNIEKCKNYICCEPKKGEACPMGFPTECSECTKDICSSTCGNNVCEPGEASYCPPYECPAGKSEPCPQPACYEGTCPEDCTRSKIRLEITRPKNGEKVSGTVNVEATARGESLGDMYLEIEPSKIVSQTPPCEKPPCPVPAAEKTEQYPMNPPAEIGTRPVTGIKFTDCVTAVSETLCDVRKDRTRECRSWEMKQCKYKWDTSGYKGWTALKASISDSAKNRAEDSAKVYVYSKKQLQPVCERIGTDLEGWYADGQLLRYEKCYCRAICSRIGSGEEGWYSSCTNEVIKYEKCSIEEPIEVTIRNKPVKIEQRPDEGIVEITSEDRALTKEKIIIKEDRLEMPTVAGVREIKYLPEEARDKAIEQAQLYRITAIEIKKENEKPVYEVTGKKKEYFFWIIPYDADRTVKVDAETNEVVG